MHLSEEHESTVKFVSGLLQKAGYEVKIGTPIGPQDKPRFADITAINLEKGSALLIEVKAGVITGSSDVLTVESYKNSAASMPASFAVDRPIEAVIISAGTIDPAKVLSKELGIKIIEAKSYAKIEEDLNQLIAEAPEQ